MIKNISIGVTNAIRAYLGESLVWQAPPKLSANFTTGEYKASGVTKTFAEVFDFNRAGKAWLVKDTGLQEYEADVPRFDNGLLIEQSATNLIDRDSLSIKLVPDTGDFSEISHRTIEGFNQVKAADGRGAKLYVYFQGKYNVALQNEAVGSYYLISIGDSCDIEVNSTINTMQADKLKQFTSLETGSIYRPVSPRRYANNNNTWLGSRYHQLEMGNTASTYILTTTAPVTRPADFLQTKVTGTTITGDWGSTLNLSISNGQIVHSGYGRIRSLEIR